MCTTYLPLVQWYISIWRVNRNTHEHYTNVVELMTFDIRSLARTRFSDFFQHMTGNSGSDANAVEQVSRATVVKKENKMLCTKKQNFVAILNPKRVVSSC
ncbi:unnamed protein product [Ceratitis capitata]|uniref:(Mediterranean fruit fly) hypothetical protein n=1 Tax=Ceratitis capitata TaxID=7213 RepID=A0A811VGD9_CERCA|nr:unnamed protein product [Ceratitis capitata]